MASVSCPIDACNNVIKKCKSLRLNEAKCQVLLSYIDRIKKFYHPSTSCDSAKSEFRSAVKRAQHLVDESGTQKEWLLKAVELWECSEHFVEVFVDLCWSAQIMAFYRSEGPFTEERESLLNSRRPTSAQAGLLERQNHDDKRNLGAMVKGLLNPGALKNLDGEEHQLVHLLNDRFEDRMSWYPPILTSLEFSIQIRFMRSSSSTKRGQDGIVFPFAWVYKRQFVVKMWHPDTNNGKTFKDEFDVLDKYRSPYIVGVVGYWELTPASQWRPWRHEVSLRPFLLMEAMECNLEELISRYKKSRKTQGFSALEAIKLMLPISKALRFLHAKEVVHRDVKLKNIMCSNTTSKLIDDVIVKLIDFGEAKVDVSKFSFGHQHHGRVGTNGFMAPEMFTPQGCSDLKRADVFSFAMVFLELLTWRWPWEEIGVQQGKEVQDKLRLGERPTLPEGLPQFVRFIVESCWSADPEMRPTFDDICSMLQNAKLLILDKSFGEGDDLFSYLDATFVRREYIVDRAEQALKSRQSLKRNRSS